MSRFWGMLSLLLLALILMAACWFFMLPISGCNYDHLLEVKEVRLTVEKVVIAELHGATTQPVGGFDRTPATQPAVIVEIPDHE